MASVAQCAGAGPGPPALRVRAAGPDDVAWSRPLRWASGKAGAPGTVRGLVPTHACLWDGDSSGGLACGDLTGPLPWGSDAPAPAVPWSGETWGDPAAGAAAAAARDARDGGEIRRGRVSRPRRRRRRPWAGGCAQRSVRDRPGSRFRSRSPCARPAAARILPGTRGTRRPTARNARLGAIRAPRQLSLAPGFPAAG